MLKSICVSWKTGISVAGSKSGFNPQDGGAVGNVRGPLRQESTVKRLAGWPRDDAARACLSCSSFSAREAMMISEIVMDGASE